MRKPMMHDNREQSPNFSTVTDYFVWDHDAMDALLHEVVSHVREQSWKLATHTLARFAARVGRHIEMEENIVFPLVRDRCPELDADAEEADAHPKIQEALARLTRAVSERSQEEVARAYDAMERVLPRHALYEETELYPAIDAVLGKREQTALVASLVAYRNDILSDTWATPLPREKSFRSRSQPAPN